MPLDLQPDNPPENLHELLEAAKPKLLELELSPEETRRIIGRERVLELSDILLTSWAAVQGWLDTELSPVRAEQRKAELAGLDSRAWVFYAADLAADEIHSDTEKKARAKLARKVKEHDRFLMTWAMPSFGHDPDHAATLRDISRGSGRRDDAEDVQRLVILFEKNWDLAEKTQKAVTKLYLAEAAADAVKQLDYLRKRKKNPARELADAAYVLWYRDYEQLMALGRHLTRHDDDSVQRFPGVQEERGAPAPVKAEEPGEKELAEEDDEEEEEDEDEEEAEDEAADDEDVPKPVDENK